MVQVKCKECGCDIYYEYTPLEGKPKKHLSKLQQQSTIDCNTTIYLTCDNEHIEKYFCVIKDGK